MRRRISERIDEMRGTSIKARSARGVATLGVGTGVERGVRFVRNMILARVLAPDQFGLMAIINVVALALEAIMEVGVKQSVIQNKKGADGQYLNVAWWMQAVRGLSLYGIAVLLAPWISGFYEEGELLSLLRVAFIAVALRGFISPRAYVLEKEYRFGRVVFLAQGSAILGAVIAVALAFVLRNVWALVLGLVAESFFMCVLSYVLAPFVPRLQLDRKSLGELLRFARGMFGLAILTVVARQTDVFVLGRTITGKELGIYYLARALVQLPGMMFTKIIGPVLLPAFAEMQDSTKVLRRNTLKLIGGTFLFGVPLAALAAILSKPILSLVYGSEFGSAAVPFAIMCFVMLFQIQAVVLASVYLAIGKPHWIRRFTVLLAVLVVCLIYPGVRLFGVAGAAGVLLLSNIIAVCVQVIHMRKTIGLHFRDYLFSWRRSKPC